MALNITPGFLPPDGSKVTANVEIKDFVENTIIDNYDLDNFTNTWGVLERLRPDQGRGAGDLGVPKIEAAFAALEPHRPRTAGVRGGGVR